MDCAGDDSIDRIQPCLESLFSDLADEGHGRWVDQLRFSHRSRLGSKTNGHWSSWCSTIQRLPEITATDMSFSEPAVTINGDCTDAERAQIERALRNLHPWRKGPFRLFGVEVDAEWRSDMKWDRVSAQIDLTGKRILDVGCGNGYYGWRMLGAGASVVVGLEPYPLYNVQHRAIHRYAPTTSNFVIAASDDVLSPCQSVFDVTFSMGVLYHCKDLVGHLEGLRRTTKPDGTVVLETLVIDGDDQTAFFPEDRYAKMRNVWLIPSVKLTQRLLKRTGFRRVEVANVTPTGVLEQRSTDWMTYESLSDFLDPLNPKRTIEGYPAPTRAIFLATS